MVCRPALPPTAMAVTYRPGPFVVPLPSLPAEFYRQDRHRHAQLQAVPVAVSPHVLHLEHQPERCVQPETAPGFGRDAEDRLASGVPHLGSLAQRHVPVRWPCGCRCYVGRKAKNKHGARKRRARQGTVGKTAVAGVKDWPTHCGVYPVGRPDAELVRTCAYSAGRPV